ncbi:MAG: sulfurtransferase TusA family protein [Chloroflexi bacterium CFX4]|nr:sulfurtransferase TusA family protein [Chloroflexi bacterium CFX4]MDL1924013.1 sulfurtransferase TusA family protein [Chloroflexi bacterium CFX3]
MMQRVEQPIGETFASNLEICYEVLLYLASRMARLPAGEALEYLSGDPEAAAKISAWCEAREFTLVCSERLPDDRWRFVIKKG